MTVSLTFDASDALALADDLGAAVDGLVGKVRAAIKDGATEIRDGMRSDMAASGSFGQIAPAISFDATGNASFAEAQIGPVKGSPGSLANIAYFGGANGGGGTVRDPLEPALEAAPAIEAALTAVLADLLS